MARAGSSQNDVPLSWADPILPTPPITMKFARLTTLFIAYATCAQPLRATPLTDLLEEHHLQWLLGKWVTEGVHMSYELKLGGHAIGLKVQMADRETEGFIMLKPGTQETVYGAGDNHGGVSQGKWVEQHGHATLKVKHTTSEGQVLGMAIEHYQGDDKSMHLMIYNLDAQGEPTPEGHEVTLRPE